MSAKRNNRVSNAVIRRLPRYYRHLDDLYHGGVVRISSTSLAQSMGLTASQIRQDLSCFGGFGQQGYGYNVEKLRDEVSLILGMTAGYRAIIVGAGNLGRALIHNFPFEKNGFVLTAAFDCNPVLAGTVINGVPVLPSDDLEDYLKENPTTVAVMTVPQKAAEETAERLVRAGVKGLWNFTNVELNIQDPGIQVESVHFADSLLALSYFISNKDEEEQPE